ncbi:hypothetical protein GF323_01685 [Candidatus Woesearchaeota archaeon]|nr:hypothetical protein [Candidatus Woesearchaeota archaeon]
MKLKLSVKKELYNKIDESFHSLFFRNAFGKSGLELMIEDSVYPPFHTLKTKGTYITDGKRKIAFSKPIKDKFKCLDPGTLADDYSNAIIKQIDNNIYDAKKKNGNVLIKARITTKDINHAIQEYINSRRSYLTQAEFMALTHASEYQLERVFGSEHDTIVNRRYNLNDVLRFSKKFFKRHVTNTVNGKMMHSTEYQIGANIMNIYRRLPAEFKPDIKIPGKQGVLFE